MTNQIKVTSAWAAVACALILPIVAAIILVYADVEKLKVTKAEKEAMLELKVSFSEQMARNTTAIENLNDILKDMRGIRSK